MKFFLRKPAWFLALLPFLFICLLRRRLLEFLLNKSFVSVAPPSHHFKFIGWFVFVNSTFLSGGLWHVPYLTNHPLSRTILFFFFFEKPSSNSTRFFVHAHARSFNWLSNGVPPSPSRLSVLVGLLILSLLFEDFSLFQPIALFHVGTQLLRLTGMRMELNPPFLFSITFSSPKQKGLQIPLPIIRFLFSSI